MEKIHFLETATGRGLMTILEAFPLDENGQASRAAIMVLLSDGQNQSGIDPIVMAKRAARLGCGSIPWG